MVKKVKSKTVSKSKKVVNTVPVVNVESVPVKKMKTKTVKTVKKLKTKKTKKGFVVNDFEELYRYESSKYGKEKLAPYFKRIDVLAEKGVLLFRNTVGQLITVFARHLQSEIKKRMSYDYFSDWADEKGLLFHKYSGVMMNDKVKNLDFDEVYKKYRG